MTPDQARAVLLALPGIAEADHHGKASYRDSRRIVATVPGPGLLNVMVDEAEARAAVASDPDVFALVRWGQRVAAVQVQLAAVGPVELVELVAVARSRSGVARPPRAASTPGRSRSAARSAEGRVL